MDGGDAERDSYQIVGKGDKVTHFIIIKVHACQKWGSKRVKIVIGISNLTRISSLIIIQQVQTDESRAKVYGDVFLHAFKRQNH